MKPNSSFTVKQMKDYIRSKKLNHPDVKLSMKKADMIAGLKKAGHWEEKPKEKAKPKKPVKKSAKKLSTLEAKKLLGGDLPKENYGGQSQKSKPKAKSKTPKKTTGFSGASYMAALQKAKSKTKAKAKPKAKAKNKTEENAYDKNFVYIATIFSDSSLIWVDNKYIMKKGNQLDNTPKPIIGYYTNTPLWKKLGYFNYGKNKNPAKNKIAFDKFNTLLIDDRKVTYLMEREKNAYEETKKDMDYDGFIEDVNFDKPEENEENKEILYDAIY